MLPNIFEKHRDSKNWDYIYNIENNIDLLFMGSSQIFTSVNPNVIDPVINSNSFVLGSSGQNIIQSYYNLIEILKYRKPKIIVLDLKTMLIDKKDQKVGLIYHNLSGMNLSTNKINSFLNTVNNKSFGEVDVANLSYFKQFEFILTLITKEKFNWKNDIKSFDQILYVNKHILVSKGFLGREPKILQKEFNILVEERNNNSEKIIINPENMYYLEKFINICKGNNINLVFIKTPTLLNEDINNELTQYIIKHNIKYYNFETIFEEFDFSYIDFGDKKHLSITGAKKFSSFFADIFKTYYTNIN